MTAAICSNVYEKTGSKQSKTNSAVSTSQDKRRLLAQLLRNKRKKASQARLSFTQSRLWFLNQLEPDNTAYNLPMALRLTGELDKSALSRSLNEILCRHEILRASFTAVEGNPLQQIAKTAVLPITAVDLSAIAPEKRATEAQRQMEMETTIPFDLQSTPLLRARLFELDENDHIFFVVVHHIIFDRWSKGIFFNELLTLYEAYRVNQESPLAPLPAQYTDFSRRQQAWAQTPAYDRQLAYWKAQLSDPPPALELPTDRPRPTVHTDHGAELRFLLPATLSQAIKRFSQESGATSFMTLLAAFSVLLSRYSGEQDIVVGAPIANRGRKKLEPLIGFFANTLALRIDLHNNPTFETVLKQVRQTALDAYMHQDMPFERLVEELQPARQLTYNPLFQTLFALQNTPLEIQDVAGLTAVPLEVEKTTARLDLAVLVTETAVGFECKVEYNTDLFDASTLERFCGHYRTLLEGIIADPQRPIAALPLLTEAERRQILLEWNDTAVAYPNPRCVHQVFEDVVEKMGEKTAVVDSKQQLSYRQLNQRANQLAHYLRRQNIGTESVVGICLERSSELVVAMLATLKAGGAYLPLDSSYPQERLAFMIADAGVTTLVTQRSMLKSLPPNAAAHLICLDEERDQIRAASVANPAANAALDRLAYIIYTSGSTGRPKGVELLHTGLHNLAMAQMEAFQLGTDGRLFQFVSPSFDVATGDIFTALCSGAALHLAPANLLTDGTTLMQLPQLLRKQAITHIELPVSVLDALPDADFPALRVIVAGGEACPVEVVDRWAPNRLFINAYGPTEATVCATFAVCQPNAERKPSIGRPLNNVQTYILDQQLQLVPVGVAGELYLAGAGVARGYRNNSQLTAEKFIQNPFGDEVGNGRLYKTGDLARYLPNGVIEFLGRVDTQVKIRGFRIEVDEIKTVLIQHPQVADAVVAVHCEENGSKRLVAYFTAVDQFRPPASTGLAQFLIGKLPAYMMPSVYLQIEQLPLTRNGKINYKALPIPPAAAASPSDVYVAPRNDTEKRLTAIWNKVLSIEEISVYDDFFALGGHSLLAVRLMSLIQQVFGAEVPLAELFQGATIAHLAQTLDQHTSTTSQLPLVAIQPNGSKPPFFCVHPVGGNVLCYADLARQMGPDQPFYGLQAQGLHGNQQPLACIENMAAYYIKALKTIQPSGPYFLGGWSMGGVVAFEMARQLEQQGETVALLALLDSRISRMDDNQLQGAADGNGRIAPQMIKRFLSDLEGGASERWAASLTTLQNATAEELMRYALDRAKQKDLIPSDGEANQLHRLLTVFATHMQALTHYKPGVYSGEIMLFQSGNGRSEHLSQASVYGWSALSNRPVEIFPMHGNHYTMMLTPHVNQVANQLRESIDLKVKNWNNRQ